jgi:adenosylcobinamide hydrolase
MKKVSRMRGFFISKNFIRGFDYELSSLSSAPYKGGLSKAKGFFFIYVDKNYSGDYRLDCEEFAVKYGLKDFVGFMTAVDISEVLTHFKCGGVEVYVTAGLSNLETEVRDFSSMNTINTINIALIIDKGLSINGMVNAIITATEAKAKVVYEKYRAAGTTSDGIGVFCKEGREDWAGHATEVGREIKISVSKAVEKSILKWEKIEGDSL